MNKVEQIAERLRAEVAEKKTRFSSEDFKELVYTILSDKDFKTKKFVIEADELIEKEGVCINSAMNEFLSKFLTHAGIKSPEERESIIDSFSFKHKDIEFMQTLIEEAIFQYIDAGKSIKIFKDKIREFGIKKYTRTGKYDGEITYKRMFVDKEKRLKKKKEKQANK